MADFDKALELNPSYDIIYALRGDASFELKQECGQATADYGKALELNPQNLRALNGKAWHLATCSDTKYRDGVKAIELAQKAVELCPLALYFDTLAAAYAEAGRFEDAITTQEKAIALAKKEGYAPNRIGQYTLRLSSYSSHAEGGFEEAKEDFEKTLKNPYLDEDTKEVLRGIEDLEDLKAARLCLKGFDYLFRTVRFAKAIREFDKAIEINPRFAIAYYGRGYTYWMQEKHDKAIAAFNKAIEINPKFALAYQIRGTIYHEKRQYDQAISDYNRAIEINPKFVRAYLYRGCFYEATRQYDKAISDYTKAIEINPRYVEAYNFRGLVMWKLGNTEKACSDWKRACELGGTCYYSNCE
jgi:tetratricopeptide (TPR) repeat protein